MVKEDGFFRHSMPLQEPIKDELVKVKFTKGWDQSHDGMWIL